MFGSKVKRDSTLRRYDATFEDSILDPFKQATDRREYLNLEKSDIRSLKLNGNTTSIKGAQFVHEFHLDTNIQILKRSQVNFWEFISEIGGYHDGLCLIVGLAVRAWSASYFEHDLVRDSWQARKDSKKQRLARIKPASSL